MIYVFDGDMKVRIDYTNWKGERNFRIIQPLSPYLYFGQSEYHPELQWLLYALDVKKNANRTFAMKDIHSWEQFNDEILGS